MAATISAIFDFIEQNERFFIDIRKVSSYNFSILRRNMHIIINNLYECDDLGNDISHILRTRLYQLLTVPVPFDDKIIDDISTLGEPSNVHIRWGQDIQDACDASREAAYSLGQIENPMRCEIRSVIGDLTENSKRFKIYCHRLARPHFVSILGAQSHELTDAGIFLHTTKDYREVEPFDVLIKIGPLRSGGWGGCPDALLTAPRFKTLIHFMWSGCENEQGFGLDPVTGSSIIEGTSINTSIASRTTSWHGISWASSVKITGANQIENGPQLIDEDEFKIFHAMTKDHDKRSAILAQIDDEHGILFPARSLIFSIDLAAGENEQIGRRMPGETLTEGMFLIFPILDDVDLGGCHAKDGKLSPLWKQLLVAECKKDQDGLCKKLSGGGIELLCLHSRVKEWCKAPTTVIPAPQRAEHFKVLIDVLGIDFTQRDVPQRDQCQGWQCAWREIRRSRGEAIAEGLFGHEIVEEKIEEILNMLLGEIRDQCARGNDVCMEIPPGEELQGRFRLCKVVSLEEGFHAPEAALKNICNLTEFEQWRV